MSMDSFNDMIAWGETLGYNQKNTKGLDKTMPYQNWDTAATEAALGGIEQCYIPRPDQYEVFHRRRKEVEEVKDQVMNLSLNIEDFMRIFDDYSYILCLKDKTLRQRWFSRWNDWLHEKEGRMLSIMDTYNSYGWSLEKQQPVRLAGKAFWGFFDETPINKEGFVFKYGAIMSLKTYECLQGVYDLRKDHSREIQRELFGNKHIPTLTRENHKAFKKLHEEITKRLVRQNIKLIQNGWSGFKSLPFLVDSDNPKALLKELKIHGFFHYLKKTYGIEWMPK